MNVPDWLQSLSASDWIQSISIIILGISIVVSTWLTRSQIAAIKRQNEMQQRQMEHERAASSRQLDLMNEQMVRQFDWYTRAAALEFAIGRNDSFREARMAVDTAFRKDGKGGEPLSLQDIERAIEKAPELQIHIFTVLGTLENMALSIHAQIANEAVAFETIAGTTLKYVDRFRLYIDHRRATENRRAYDYLLELEQTWRSKLAEAERLQRPVFTNLKEPLNFDEMRNLDSMTST